MIMNIIIIINNYNYSDNYNNNNYNSNSTMNNHGGLAKKFFSGWDFEGEFAFNVALFFYSLGYQQ